MTLIDVVIVITLLEGLVLAAWHRTSGRGLAPSEFMPNLVAGLALMLALRAGGSALGWGWVAVALAVAGLAHAADVRRRLRRR